MTTQKPDDLEAEPEPQSFSDTERYSPSELTSMYLSLKRVYRDLVARVERASRGAGGIESTGNQMFWGSVLFTRISVISKSIEKLLPNTKPREHWDFSSLAALSRNLVEAVLVYHWLCGDGIDQDVRQGRFILLYLHDYGSRRRLFPDGDWEDSVYSDLVAQFDANPYLATFNEKQRRVALRGEKTPFVQDDVLIEIGENPDEFRTMYRFFSQHTHTGPVAFYRMTDHVRGTGVETAHEKRYMMYAIGMALTYLSHALKLHLLIFPDAETRRLHLTLAANRIQRRG